MNMLLGLTKADKINVMTVKKTMTSKKAFGYIFIVIAVILTLVIVGQLPPTVRSLKR